ncbi:phage baseplate assembly protein V [Psychromonas aquimarina]|uniref:phage baseplate assembly protein V n=1 Tax=Psychromonas aquimarina TaxID=444919 RepID=UPI000426A0D1|nr:phage baseplate assembly protein V [Psychromonas aquimarina]
MFETIMNRLKNLFGTGISTRVETGIVQLRLATGITNDRIKRVHNYGFMSRPLPQSKAYTLFVGGDTSRGIAVCIEDERHQMELAPGDVAILDDKGNLVHFKESGIKVVTKQTLDITADKDVKVKCVNAAIDADKTTINSETEINGNTKINGNATITGICAVGGLAKVGGGAVPAKGGLEMTGGDVVVDGISTTLHTHKENGTGGGITGGPQ